MFSVDFSVYWFRIIHLQKQCLFKFLVTSYSPIQLYQLTVFCKIEFTVHLMAVFVSILWGVVIT